jgi:hypothetical protein
LWLCPTLGGDRLDLSGNGNHGTYNGGMGTVADKYKGSRAYDFTGTSKRIALGTSLNDAFYGDHSYSAWIRISGDIFNAEPSPTILGSTNTSGTWVEFSYGKTVGGQIGGVTTFADDGASNGGAIVSGVPEYWLENNDWHHLSAVRDYSSNNVYFYLDGLLTDVVPFVGNPISSMTQDLFIGYSGRLGYAGNTFSSGVKIYYDDIRVYDRTLGAGEVKHLSSKRGVLGSPRQPYDPLKRTVVRVPAAIPAATVVGSIKKPKTIIKPSYRAGYARNASESENPQLWDGLVSWVPSLGSSGSTVRCIQDKSRGIKNNGITFSGSSEQSLSNGAFLSFDGSDDYMRIYDSSLKNAGGLNPEECLAVKFRRRSLTGTTALFGYLSAGFLGAYGRGFYFDGTTMHCISESNNNTPPITSTVDDNKWHVAIANFGANGSFYLDGKLIGTGSLRFSWNYWLQLASASAHVSPPSNSANAAVDVSVAYQWDRLLTAGEIKKISVDSLAPFRKKQRVSVAVPAAVPTPSATYHPLRSLAHPLEQ